jgi:hypothetical protein
MGTAKYAAFVLFALTVGWALRLYLLQAKIADTVASGPCALASCASTAVHCICRTSRSLILSTHFCSQVLVHVRVLSAAASGTAWLYNLQAGPVRAVRQTVLLYHRAAASRENGAAGLGGALWAGSGHALLGVRAQGVQRAWAHRKVRAYTLQRAHCIDHTWLVLTRAVRCSLRRSLVGGIVLPILSPSPTPTNRQQLLAERQRAAQAAAAAQGGAAAAAAAAAADADTQGLRRRGHHYEDTLLPPEQGGAAPGAAAALREEDIAQLQAICSRGRIDVIAALQRTGGNVEAAANILLSQDR